MNSGQQQQQLCWVSGRRRSDKLSIPNYFSFLDSEEYATGLQSLLNSLRVNGDVLISDVIRYMLLKLAAFVV